MPLSSVSSTPSTNPVPSLHPTPTSWIPQVASIQLTAEDLEHIEGDCNSAQQQCPRASNGLIGRDRPWDYDWDFQAGMNSSKYPIGMILSTIDPTSRQIAMTPYKPSGFGDTTIQGHVRVPDDAHIVVTASGNSYVSASFIAGGSTYWSYDAADGTVARVFISLPDNNGTQVVTSAIGQVAVGQWDQLVQKIGAAVDAAAQYVKGDGLDAYGDPMDSVVFTVPTFSDDRCIERDYDADWCSDAPMIAASDLMVLVVASSSYYSFRAELVDGREVSTNPSSEDVRAFVEGLGSYGISPAIVSTIRSAFNGVKISSMPSTGADFYRDLVATLDTLDWKGRQ